MKKSNFQTNIFLVGMMGCGKSTIGKLLAKSLGFTFIDTDDLIEKDQKCSVNDIFKKHGEEYFRQLESKSLLLIPNKFTVIATGGGLPIHSDNMNMLNQKGVAIYLQADVTSIRKRISFSSARPLYNNDENKINEMIQEREKYYLLSKFVINTVNKDPAVIISEILNLSLS